ncbi:MAG: hypothetical protein IJ678_00245 [Kiritimatiellae bacterium]|nr:hypothetical protein [Kiritimatiellia bacterium]
MSVWTKLRRRILDAVLSALGLAPEEPRAAAPEGDCYGVGWESPAAAAPQSPDGEAPSAPSSAAESPDGEAPSSPIAPILFKFGGVKADPAEDARCRISGLKIGSTGLSFHWDGGIPAGWKRGATAKGPMVLACAFYWDERAGAWTGGKFDWIDESRTTRDFANIREGYGGWDAAAFFAAPRRAFCVASADGKYRSNLLSE